MTQLALTSWWQICPRQINFYSFQGTHRRRMETEAKAKVVASVWGAKLVQFHAALAVLPRLTCKKTLENVEFILFYQIDRGKTASAARI